MVTFALLVYRVSIMNSKTLKQLIALSCLALPAFSLMAKAEDAPLCRPDDRACLLAELRVAADAIAEQRWRDQTYRDLAKLYTAQGMSDAALALVPLVDHPDTRAMTIRGIGMELAKLDKTKVERDPVFTALRVEADKIEHPPSHGIALTYIAMAQAFAGDDDGAFATARAMTNDALRNKAFGENAEIQAERGDLTRALESLGAIDDVSFRNKAHGTVAKVFADHGFAAQALDTARRIGNDYQRAQTFLYILSKADTAP